jgi:hypothetical protein
VRAVLQRLRDHGWVANALKCEWFKRSVDYLGFNFGEEGIRMKPGRVQAMADVPVPRDRTQLRRFIGVANFYRRFIRGFRRSRGP